MTDIHERDVPSDKIQFNTRSLLIVMTAACVLFGLLAWLLPKSLPAEVRVMTFASYFVLLAIGIWNIVSARRDRLRPRQDYVTVKVDAKWLRRVKSKRTFLPIAALTGVSVSFAPAFLFGCGQFDFGWMEYLVVPLCFIIIYAVPGFYMSLAGEVLGQLAKMETPPAAPEGMPTAPAGDAQQTSPP